MERYMKLQGDQMEGGGGYTPPQQNMWLARAQRGAG